MLTAIAIVGFLQNYHVQDCSNNTGSQLYHPCSGGEFRFKASSGCDRDPETRLAVVRPYGFTPATLIRMPPFQSAETQHGS